jgi:RNA polymerase sigma-70 factor (ECF subfamily)
VRGLQAPELHNHQEQAERPGSHRDAQVLPLGPPAHPPQGDPLRRPLGPGNQKEGPPIQLARGDELSQLVERARDGDHGSFTELVRQTYADTYALAFRLTGNEDDACDVLQDAYLRAYRSVRKFRGDCAFSTWLYRITANCAATHLARRGRWRHEVLDEDTHPADQGPERDPEAVAAASLERDRVARAVMDLPPRLRAVVVLRDVYDLTHEAIAAELGISETAAKVRLHRARRRLREQLFPLPGEGSRADAV